MNVNQTVQPEETILPGGHALRDQSLPYRWVALGFVLAGYLSVFAGVTIMNVALPAAQADLGLSDAVRQWVVTIYALCFGALMLAGGRLADVIGVRRCFAAGILGFAGASLLGGLAGNAPVFLTARALQGATGALVAATGLALLSMMFPDGAARAHAFAVMGIVMGLGTAGSFLLAGGLVDGLSWRWCMLINVPIGVIVAAGLIRTAPTGATTGQTRLDIGGAALVTAAVALLVTGFDRAAVLGWTRPLTLTLLLTGLVFTALLIAWLRRSSHPLIPPSLVADSQRATAFAAVFIVGIGIFAGMFLLTTYLQDMLGYSALVTGLAFLPYGVSATLTSHYMGAWARRMAPSTMLALGLLVTAAAIAVFAVVDPAAGYWGVLPMMILLGAGGTVVMVIGSSTATLGAGPHSGVAGALVNSSQQVGAAVGTAMLAAIVAAATVDQGADSALQGYNVAGAAGGAFIAATAILIYVVSGLSGRRASPG